MTTKDTILGSLGFVAWVGTGAYVWQVAAPDFSDETKPKIILLWLAAGIGFVLWGMCKSRGRRMSFLEFMAWGGGLGLCAGFIVWGMFALAEKTPTEAANTDTPDDPTALVISKSAGPVMVTMSPLIPDPDLKPADPDDLEFYFFALMAAAGKNNIQYANVTVTNRSQRKMHLEIWGEVDYWKDNGESARTGMKAEWNPDGLKQGTGHEFIDLDAWETKKGRLVLFLSEPKQHDGVGKWFLSASENVYFDVFDSVTGKRITFKPISGYPKDQMPSPLPSHKELLALDFPKVAVNAAQAGDVPDPIDLLVRTRDLGYNKTRASVEALFKNFSPKPMELEVNLLVRSITLENTWRSSEGLIKDEDPKGSQGDRALRIEPGANLVRKVIFDLAALGIPSTGGWELREQPKDTLLEINDRISGRKVWCALLVGYPPGTDMRSAVIITKSEVNSANPLKDESNDTK